MFKNVGKEIKEELQGVVGFTTLIYTVVPAILMFLLYYWGVIDESLAINGGILIVPFIGACGYLGARRKVMYRYAYAELVETVQQIRTYMENSNSPEEAPAPSPNQWQCLKCNAINKEKYNFCACCGTQKPKLSVTFSDSFKSNQDI